MPTLLGVAPYAGINFCTYELLKLSALSVPWLSVRKPSSEGDSPQDRDLKATTRLMCGGVAGAIGQTVVYPLDTVRRRMQMDGFIDGQPAGKYSGPWLHVLRVIYTHEVLAPPHHRR